MDKDRLDKLILAFSELFTIRKALEMIKFTIKELYQLVLFQNVTVFVLEPNLVALLETAKPESDKVYVSRG